MCLILHIWNYFFTYTVVCLHLFNIIFNLNNAFYLIRCLGKSALLTDHHKMLEM